MANKPKILRAVAQRAVDDRVAHHEQHGAVPPELVRAHAETTGYSPRHLRRLLNQRLDGDPGGRPEFAVTEQVVTAVFLACGCLARAWRLLEREGIDIPSLSTFKRRVIAELGTDQIAYAKGGSAAFRDAQVYLASTFPHRLHTVQLDHTELPIWVVPRGYKQAVKPWMTVVLDAKTRYVLGWTITFGRPTATEVRAALMSAMTMRLAPDGVTPVGGLPMRAVWDRGLEFLANLVTESCLRLGVLPVALPAYSPHLKGRLEKFWLFIKGDCLSVLPGYNEGPVDLRGNRAIATAALGEDEFLAKIDGWIDQYLTQHVVAGEATPLDAWKADATPLTAVDPEQLWIDMLVAKDRCKVSKNGIRFDRIDWIAPELTGTIGRKVEIRFLPHDRKFIEVFLDGEHLCTAHPQGTLSDDEEEAVLAHRRQQRNLARNRFTTANRQRRNNSATVHRLVKDKDGNRHVAEEPDDLLDGTEAALAELLSADADQGRLF